jgi:4-hydroxy-3-methylbut-2-enyl diphosphate reductase
MKVLVAEKCGVCLGVKNAIMLAKKTLAEQSTVYSLGPIIHNDEVVHELAQKGLKAINSIEQIDSGTVLIRSHGATKQQLQEIEKRGLNIVDATCVLVKRLQKISHKLNQDGYKVVIIGDEKHPEVQAIVGFAENVAVIGSQADLQKLSGHGKLGIICQTTQSPDHFAEMIAEIAKKGFSELKIINTLCREAIKRQNSAVELCRKVDIMFVLGSLHSANTRKLAELCRKYNEHTYHLQNWQKLDKKIIYGKMTAGVTAGASTPDRVIQEFVEKLGDFNAAGRGNAK